MSFVVNVMPVFAGAIGSSPGGGASATPAVPLRRIHFDPTVAGPERDVGPLLEAERLVERNGAVLFARRHADERDLADRDGLDGVHVIPLGGT